MEIKILKGRDRKLVDSIGHEIITMLDEYFAQSIAKLNASISLEISEFTDFYYKR
jgi:5-carboxymethyl-2-hydroxymuconate isomerase